MPLYTMGALPVGNQTNKKKVIKPADLSGRQKLVFVLVIGFTSLFINSAVGAIGPVFPLEARKLFPHEAKRYAITIGAAFSIGTLSFGLMAPFAGREVRVMGPKKMIALGTVLVSGGTILFSFVGHLSSWATFISYSFAFRVLQGAGGACVFSATFTMFASLFPKSVASVTACIEVFNGLGYVTGPAIGGALYETAGFDKPFLLVGLLLACMALLQACILPGTPPPPNENELTSSASVTRPRRLRKACSPTSVLAKGRAFFMLVLVCAGGATLAYCQPTLSPFLSDEFVLKPSVIGACYMINQLVKSSCAPLVGRFADSRPRPPIILFGVFSMAVGFMLMGLKALTNSVPSLAVFLLGYGLSGFGVALTLVPASAEVIQVMHEAGFVDSYSLHGSVGGLVGSFKALGMGLGPTVGSSLTKAMSFSSAAVVFSAVLAALMLGLVMQLVIRVCRKGKKSARRWTSDSSLLHSFGAKYSTVDERTHLLI